MEHLETEKDLVARAKAGDRLAFDRLAAESRPRLAAFVRSRLGAELRARHEVDDIVQEALLRAYRALERFEWQGEGSFLRWAVSIADFHLRDLARGAARLIVSPAELARDLPGREAPAEQGLRREERFDRFERAYGALSPEHQEVIRLARLEGLQIREVAERMGRSESAARHLLLRALERLRAAFGEGTESLHLPPRRIADHGGDHASA